ncbi:hypothetical protein KR009_006200 [Drosophila setifemur]|nr:hypothetical protein KR009_006200 [Drosophila setifemur]
MDNTLNLMSRMYARIPSALATPPQSPVPPTQLWGMPLLEELMARNGELNVPPGFVLCIPCYLCKRPFSDIDTFKEHLTQHAEEIHDWNMVRAQAQEKPFMQPIVHQPVPPPHSYHRTMEYPPMVSIPHHPYQPTPYQRHLPLQRPIPPATKFFIQQTRMGLPMPPHLQMPVQQEEIPHRFPLQYQIQPSIEEHGQPPVEFKGQFSMLSGEPPSKQLPVQPPNEHRIPPLRQLPDQPNKDFNHYRSIQPNPLPVQSCHRMTLPVESRMPPVQLECRETQVQPKPVQLVRPCHQLEVQLSVQLPSDQPTIEKPVGLQPGDQPRIKVEIPRSPSPFPSPECEPSPLSSTVTAPTASIPLASPPASSRPYECAWCGKRLSSNQALKYHTNRFHLSHHPPDRIGRDVQKQYKCSACKRRYKRRTFLLMHLKFKHGVTGTLPVATTSTSPEKPPPPEEPPSPECSVSPGYTSASTKEMDGRREVWCTRIYNAVAAANYQPSREPAAKYVSPPRQPQEHATSAELELALEVKPKPKRKYPLRSPFFNPYVEPLSLISAAAESQFVCSLFSDLWLNYDAYL